MKVTDIHTNNAFDVFYRKRKTVKKGNNLGGNNLYKRIDTGHARSQQQHLSARFHRLSCTERWEISSQMEWSSRWSATYDSSLKTLMLALVESTTSRITKMNIDTDCNKRPKLQSNASSKLSPWNSSARRHTLHKIEMFITSPLYI